MDALSASSARVTYSLVYSYINESGFGIPLLVEGRNFYFRSDNDEQVSTNSRIVLQGTFGPPPGEGSGSRISGDIMWRQSLSNPWQEGTFYLDLE
jgi:hypothetical protein